ncbi:MAG: MarC family protein [Candidatus Omnitrophota bacterium]|nr:MAG: MarC family protein [Candidatus Omnitrophota bacterium]
MSLFRAICLAFIPVFVAVDAVGVLPIFVSLTEGVKKDKRSKVILQSVITAICLALVFIFLGRGVFRLLNITMYDFMVAGGIILFCIGIMDIINPGKRRRIPSREVGAVPIGTPLIVGPAVLTTSLVILQEYGMVATIIAVLSNIILAGIIFSSSRILIRILGESGSKALSKVMSLLLAAIAVMMVRKGIIFIINMY